MIVIECVQNSPEWYAARLGIPTASAFDKILTPIELKKSQSAVGYRYRLLAEWLTGKPCDSYSNKSIERGAELEAEARDYYVFTTDKEVRQVGFIYRDESKHVGCSPDGIIGDFESGVELKCPDAHTHVGYLLDGRLPREYILQVQGSMWITEAKTWDFLSYHPDMQPMLVTVGRDERVINALELAVADFVTTMLIERERLSKGTTDVNAALKASLELLGVNA